MTALHISHAVTCESCGCARECDGACTTCRVCGVEWLTVTCRHCGELPVYSHEPEHRAIVDVLDALAKGHAPLAAMTCPNCHDEITSRQVTR